MKYLVIIAALLTTGCTGPFGMVFGGERVHELYNYRHQGSYRPGFTSKGQEQVHVRGMFSDGQPLDYHTKADKQRLEDQIRRY